jgi:hypothetical protein
MQLNSPLKMAYPGPPRRAVGMMRYVFFAGAVIGLLYYLRMTALNASLGSTQNSIDTSLLPGTIASHQPAEPLHAQDPDTFPGLESSDHKNEHEFKQPSSIAASSIAPFLIAPPSNAPSSIAPSSIVAAAPTPTPTPTKTPHPIDSLMEKAEKAQEEILKKQSHDLKSAAAAYRERRGRHPPPGFDVWYDFAKQNKAVMVEDFFDQIYHDLSPFWGLPASVLRKESHSYDMTINIRDQKAKTGSNWFWTEIWLNMTQSIEDMLPDMDLPLNAMDEPRISAPWEEVNRLMEIEKVSRNMPPANEVLSDFQKLSDEPDKEVPLRHKNFSDTRRCTWLLLLQTF